MPGRIDRACAVAGRVQPGSQGQGAAPLECAGDGADDWRGAAAVDFEWHGFGHAAGVRSLCDQCGADGLLSLALSAGECEGAGGGLYPAVVDGPDRTDGG